MLLTKVSRLEQLEYLAELGYDGIDISFCDTIYGDSKHDDILDGDWKSKLDVYKEKCQRLNMTINSTHLPYNYDYANTNDPQYEQYMEMTCRALEASEYMGAKWAVAHIYLSTEEDAIPKTVEYVKKLSTLAKVKNIGIAIENACGFPIEYLLKAIDILQKEGYRVGMCLDLGHTNYGAKYEHHVIAVLKELGEKISMIHLHDNCHNADYHREPYAGNMPWEEVMETLKEINFKGDFNYELMDSRIPAAIREDYDKYCVKLARYLISVFENA